MKFATLLLFFTFYIAGHLQSQSIQSEVISAFGGETTSGNPTVILSSTCGEAVAVSELSGELFFHGGFQQGLSPATTTISFPLTSAAENWLLSPNPNKGNFQLQRLNLRGSFQRSTYRIFDAAGKLLHCGSLAHSISHFSLEMPPPGIYFIQLFSEEETPVSIPFLVADF
jgi:hypothetical protein